MKNLLLIVLLSMVMFAQSYQEFALKYGYETNYEKALTRAKKEKKEILMVQVSNYCPWCRKLEKRTLADSKIDKAIHKDYIPLIVNRQEKTLHKRFDTPIIPVTYIIDYKDDSKFIDLRGYQGKNEFLTFIEK